MTEQVEYSHDEILLFLVSMPDEHTIGILNKSLWNFGL
jgi:hypothetical protein